MFSFQYPWFALLLPLPILIWWLWPQRQASHLPQIRIPNLAFVQQAFQVSSVSPVRNRWLILRWLLLWLTWISFVFAAMAPQWVDKQIEIRQSGYDLMLAVDLSESMLQDDFRLSQRQVSRLQAVKVVLIPFVDKRVGDRIGLVLFADHAYLQSPLTLDNQAVKAFIERAAIGMAGQKTAIGDAIGLAVKKLRERPEDSRVLILLTDGENTAGKLSPLKAAEIAKQYKIRIYTVGVGQVSGIFGRGFDEQTLREIAKMTGGAYFSATNLNALSQVYNKIDKNLQKTEADSRIYLQRTHLYRIPLIIGLFSLLGLYILRLKVYEAN
ncbi:VWA domain-containing protein [Candidatus Albibeggiatoa sp. nov. BB20]|uniref:vWA domain-containing protein n=1 Tax=Candidatus Albibeggiatoa sp. nov. BB20 TaxID=3162723 RepID=UPI0033658E84